MSGLDYLPHPTSVAGRVCAFFRINPHEELTADDVAEKFGCVRGSVHTLLVSAVDTELLRRARSLDGDYIYRLGSRLHKTESSAGETNSGQTFDYSGAPVLDNVPIPTARQRRDDGCLDLLKRLQPTQCAVLPITEIVQLKKTVKKATKASLGTFTIRSNKTAGTVSVWRTS